MMERFATLIALALVFPAVGCTSDDERGEEGAGSVRLGLSLDVLGAERIEFSVTPPTALAKPLVGSLTPEAQLAQQIEAVVAQEPVLDPSLSFVLVLPAASGYEN